MWCGSTDDLLPQAPTTTLAFVYSWAGYERLEASYVKSSEKLKLKACTLLVGSGVPAAFLRGGAHSDRRPGTLLLLGLGECWVGAL